ncbi:MAG: iron-sulfur cluster assembly protein [Chloroflexi bacterium]|jgi:metal-sulfur cluster biosynthetic enzyme|nr:iron-sulfur cluster assembly protein [Chloroflexota bacterium]
MNSYPQTDRPQKVVWQAESTHPELAENLRQSLREVIDPEIGLNIIELGLVRDVVINDQQVDMTMILTTPFCPYGPAMIEMTRKKAEAALERPVRIEMGTEMWDLSMMEEGAGGDWGLF